MAAVMRHGVSAAGLAVSGRVVPLTTDRQWRDAARLHHAAVCELHRRGALPWAGLSALGRDQRVAAFKATVLGEPPEHGQPVEQLLAHAILQAVRGGS